MEFNTNLLLVPLGYLYTSPAENTFVSPSENVCTSPSEHRYSSSSENRYRSPPGNTYATLSENMFRSPTEITYATPPGNRYAATSKNTYATPSGHTYAPFQGNTYTPGSEYTFTPSSESSYPSPEGNPLHSPDYPYTPSSDDSAWDIVNQRDDTDFTTSINDAWAVFDQDEADEWQQNCEGFDSGMQYEGEDLSLMCGMSSCGPVEGHKIETHQSEMPICFRLNSVA